MLGTIEKTAVSGAAITATHWVHRPWKQILDVSLDRPAVGGVEHPFNLALAGWIVGRSQPVHAINVLVDPFPPDGRPVLSMPLQRRDDVLARFPELTADQPCGFETVVALAGLPTEFELILEAVFADGTIERFARLHGQHGQIACGYEPVLAPMMVTSLGRTGTTWLMRLFAEHPQIAVHRAYPYEARACSYWMHAIDVLAEPHHRRQANKDGFHLDRSAVGHNPVHEAAWEDPVAIRWLRNAYVEQVMQFALQATDSFYATVAEDNGCEDVRCFAEKFHVGHGRWFVRSLYPEVREIVLVRDPRDIFCSILAFNAKRGTVGFGREGVASDDEFVEPLQLGFSRLQAVVDSDPDAIHLVRYEDLILNPVRTLASALAYARLDAGQGVVEQMLERAARDTPELVAHRTSGGTHESVGRWRRDLSSELTRRCCGAFGPILERFGYDLG